MSVYTLKRVQRLPITVAEAWDFFSTPENLKKITPEHMGFQVTSDPDFLTKIYAGQVITYTVKPLLGIPLFWMTEITHVEPGVFFVDEQRVGPYALWHHQHHFKAVSGGVEMTDLVHYRVPLGWLGDFANWLFVRQQLKQIFDYRWKALEAKFPYGRRQHRSSQYPDMAQRKTTTTAPLQPLAPMRPPLKVLILYALGQFGWSLGGYGVGNLLIYFYMPPEQGQPMFPSFLHQGAVLGVFTLIGILSAGGRLLDAFVDPLIANWSDRKQSRFGKRRWFMLWGAVPFVVCGFLVFWPTDASESASNFLWLALMIGLYYFFFAFYVIPYSALMAELGHTSQDRMLISTLTAVAWSLGFIIGNGTYAVQGIFENQGHTPVQAFQMAIAALGAAALVFLLLPAFLLDEKRYARQSVSDHDMSKSLRIVLVNPNFRQFLLADLMYWLSLTFTQLGAIYYATILLGLDKSTAFIFSLVGFLTSFLFYWPLNVWAKQGGKKQFILLAFAVFAVEFSFVAFAQIIPLPKMWLLYISAVAVSFPLAVFGVMPGAVIGDEVEKEERRSGQQLAGMFFGVRAFVMKVGISLANLIFPSLLLFGKSTENPLGVQLTALAAAGFCLAGWQAFRKYEE